MISIIICSRSKDIPTELKQNISSTIGCDFELIIIDNSKNQYSIFSAYNSGILRSNGDILCFCHDDILFRCNEWGDKVYSHYKSDTALGVLGVAGSHFLSSAPMYWSSSPFISEHNLNNDHGAFQEFFHDDFFCGDKSVEVVAVDGLCFFVKKKLFNSIRFDESSYCGFHLYDMDICMQAISNGYKVHVCNDILIEHSWSETDKARKGSYDILDKNLEIFSKKWREHLPIARGIHLPDYSIDRINRLCISAFDAKKVRKSKSYQLGRFLLSPLKLFSK